MANDSLEHSLEMLKKERLYWINNLSYELFNLGFPYDYIENKNSNKQIDKLSFSFDTVISKKLLKMSGGSKQRLYILLFSCMQIFLYKYIRKESVILGVPVLKQYEYKKPVNEILPIKVDLNNNDTFKEIVLKNREVINEAYTNQNFPLEKIYDELNIDLNKEKVFDVFMSYEDIHYNSKNLNNDKSNIRFIVCLEDETIKLNIDFNKTLYKEASIKRMYNQYLMIIDNICNNPCILIKDIKILSQKEKELIINKFNNTTVEYPKEKTVKCLFEEQVQIRGNEIAAVCKGNSLTYNKLNEKANSLARLLREKGVKEEKVVGVLLEKSLDTLISILAIIKAGGAYLPIDIEYPEERIEYMLEDTDAKVLMSRKNYADKISYTGQLIDLDDEEIYINDSSNLNLTVNPNSLLYIIYTSGSTGKPKGVMVEQRNVVRLVKNTDYAFLNENTRVLQTGAIAFDASTFEMWGPLLNGGRVYMVDKEILLDISNFGNILKDYGINILFITTALFNQLAQNNPTIFSSLTTLLVGGEALSAKYINIVRNCNNNLEVRNIYGPTENTTFSTSFIVNRDYVNNDIPIGKAINNSTAYIVDEENNLLPIGVSGELCVGGDGVARGYLNKDDVTKEKFIDNPFIPNTKMYKTGDMAKWTEDGNVQFLGRIDFQVKIRGFRIELGEIEKELLNYKSMKEAMVLDRIDSNNNKYLCAYLVSCEKINVKKLKEALNIKLPEYMVPTKFIQIEKMPLTQNGKIDRKELLKCSDELKEEENYVKPRNKSEEIIATIWSEVLGKDKVGIDNNFFSLGGDSIKIIQISSRLRKYNLKIDVQDFFDCPTIRELVGRIKNVNQNIEQSLVLGNAKLTPIQHWFFDKNKYVRNHFNHSVMLYKDGGFNETFLRGVLKKLIEHHDALRINYKLKKGTIIGFNNGISEESLSLNITNLRDTENREEKLNKEIDKDQQSINIDNGSLIKFHLFKLDEGDKLVIIIHHLVIDGVSWRILLNDLASGYKQAEKKESIIFDDKTVSFKDWSEHLNKYSENKMLYKEADYWNTLLRSDVKKLPKSGQAHSDTIKDGNTVTVALDSVNTKKLLEKCNRAFNTEINDILLTALGITFSKWLDSNKISINLEGHGRERLGEDIDVSRTIGWFTSSYPIILDIEQSYEISNNVKKVKENLRAIPNKGIGYGILKYITSSKNKVLENLGFSPEVSFNYMGQFDNDINNDVFKMDKFQLESSLSQDCERHYAIDIIGITMNNQCSFMFNYNKYEFTQEVIDKIAHDYLVTLTEIIKFCDKKEQVEFTPSDFGDLSLTFEELDIVKDQYKDIKKIYSLSSLQEGMLFHSLMDKKTGSYVVQSLFSISGDFRVDLFEESFNIILKKYDIFRTHYIFNGLRKPKQVVLENAKLKIDFRDISYLDSTDFGVVLDNFIKFDREKTFDLEKDTLMRVSVFKLDEYKYKIIWTFHHIVLDGWCLQIVFNDILENYRKLKMNEAIDISNNNNFIKYIKWLESQDENDARYYWKKYLGDFKLFNSISNYKTVISEKIYKGNSVKMIIDEKSTKLLQETAQNSKSTLSTVIQAAWGILIQKYCNVNDIVFGAVVSGRNKEIEGIESIVGLFINTIPVRIKTNHCMLFSELLKQMQSDLINSENFSYYSLNKIQKLIKDEGDIFDSIITFENYPLDMNEINLKSESMELNITDINTLEQTNYDLDIVIIPGKELEITINYNSNLYSDNFITDIANSMKRILTIVGNNSDIAINDINILTDEEKKAILNKYNNSKALLKNNYKEMYNSEELVPEFDF